MSPPRRDFERAGRLPVLLVHAPSEGRAFLERVAGRRFRFVCAVAHTETAEIEGISAAGLTPELRRFTAAADAEALFHGHPRCIAGVPSNPRGAPGPVLITVAALRLTGAPVTVFDLGLRITPDAPVTVVDRRWGSSIVTGNAVPHAAELFERGEALGAELAAAAPDEYLVVGESVPGGTTTALSLLCGLGIDARGKVSGSMPGNTHALKSRVVREALAASGLEGPGRAGPARGARLAPLRVAGAVGDPMQPFVAGLALAAHRHVPVILAGGSQMAAVLALLLGQARQAGREVIREHLAIGTTPWVARDPAADLAGLAGAVDGTGAGEADHPAIPVLAADLDFGRSHHVPLRRYERFLVKEGVGAGAAAIAAMVSSGATPESLLAEVERVYGEIYGTSPAPAPDTISR